EGYENLFLLRPAPQQERLRAGHDGHLEMFAAQDAEGTVGLPHPQQFAIEIEQDGMMPFVALFPAQAAGLEGSLGLRIGYLAALTVETVLACQVIPLTVSAGEVFQAAEVGVVTLPLLREQGVHRMMEVVAPLRVETMTEEFTRADDARIVGQVLGNEVPVPAG